MLLHEDRVHFSVEELDEANRRAGWRAEYRQLRPGPFRARLEVLESPGLVATREMLPGGLEVCGEPSSGSLAVVFAGGSGTGLHMNGQRMTPGNLSVVFPGGEFDASVAGPVEAFTVSIPADVFSDAVERSGHPSIGGRRGITLSVQVDPRSIDVFRRFAWGQRPEGESAEGRKGPVSVRRAAMHLVELIALGTDVSDRTRRRESLRRAREYVEANLGHAIRIERICAHAGVGVRTLQRLFRRELGVSPTRYVQARRLRAARRALLGLDPEGGNVTSVAMRQGFSHLGRFSGAYRSFFGETPSETRGQKTVGLRP